MRQAYSFLLPCLIAVVAAMRGEGGFPQGSLYWTMGKDSRLGQASLDGCYYF